MKKNFEILFIKFKLLIRTIVMYCYQKILGIDNEKIVFSSFSGKQYSDSGRVISEEIHHMNKNLKIVWLLDENSIKDKYNIIPEYVIKKKFCRHNFIKEISTAKVFVSNEHFKLIYKSKNQMFIDTWHGDRSFKKILYEASKNGKIPIPVYDDKVVDYCIAASSFGVERYRKAFRYNGKIICEGMPRNDALVNGDFNAKKIKEKLGIKNEKLLLFAPTFRDTNIDMQSVEIDFDKILKELSKDGSSWKLLLRKHPASKAITIKVDKNKLIDVNDYPDMADILKISDFLISDYSSSATDFALTKKPIILYIYDYDEYKNNCRDFCADPKEVGFIYANNQEELIDIIKTKKLSDYKKACISVNNYYQTNETGKSTKIICKKIMEFINDESSY